MHELDWDMRTSASASVPNPTPIPRHCVTSLTSREHLKKPKSLSIVGPLVFSVSQFVDPQPRSYPEPIGLEKENETGQTKDSASRVYPRQVRTPSRQKI
ncbi:hypothetical protein GALMADRAFT_1060334 [Galerina marginata CBS 339.88]|uniref:Uncharacterized protein n=1 Tax=Galerina marginata (strain CBS 339.88) TaxID=685588 RepID=A0A067SDG5_GALM3|nr:hypothetical protein GALMADRAFT_1060334 [Galerina marginata CBS 339.88]